MSSTEPTSDNQRLHWYVVGPFLIVVMLLAALSLASAYTLTAVRAYVGAESLWSKRQKDALAYLERYARAPDAVVLERFYEAIAVPLGDRAARIELDRPSPDLERARRGLLQGGNHADDIDSMIWLFRSFRQLPFMQEAVRIWAAADEQIEQISDLALALQRAHAQGDGVQVTALMARLGALNEHMVTLSLRFMATMSEASRMVQKLILAASLGLTLILASAAAWYSLRLLRRSAQTDQALRVSQERLQRAVDATSLCLWDVDVARDEVYLSSAWSRWLGGPEKSMRMPFPMLANHVPEAERGAVMAALVAALKDPLLRYRVEHRVRRYDGTHFWNLSEGQVVERDAQGRALRMVGTNRDISERKLTEARQLALEGKLRESQKLQAIGTLAAGIAHDFNNILGAIVGNLSLVRTEIGAGHPALVGLEQINKSAQRARTLVQQILAFGRRQPPQLQRRALQPMVQETLALMRATLPAGAQLEARLSARPLIVLADATQLQQVLTNLCTNAWHALQGQAGRIEVGLERADVTADARLPLGHLASAALVATEYAHLWVADSGCGMDAATRSRIFEPFYTTKAVGQGTGLGLSVVHGIVTAHQGTIAVDSVVGHGSCFHVYLPLTDAQDDLAPTSAWGGLDDAPAATGQGQHVILIDDDEVVLLMAERLLERLGYRVTSYLDPRDAVAAVQADPDSVDLVVSDYNMPQMSGLDVALTLMRARVGLPLVVSSGHLRDEQSQALRAAGVRELVAKERTLEELGPAVARLLGAG